MKPGAVVVAAISGYEHLAITTGLWPTLSAVLLRLPVGVRLGVCVGASGWLFVHLDTLDWLASVLRRG